MTADLAALRDQLRATEAQLDRMRRGLKADRQQVSRLKAARTESLANVALTGDSGVAVASLDAELAELKISEDQHAAAVKVLERQLVGLKRDIESEQQAEWRRQSDEAGTARQAAIIAIAETMTTLTDHLEAFDTANGQIARLAHSLASADTDADLSLSADRAAATAANDTRLREELDRARRDALTLQDAVSRGHEWDADADFACEQPLHVPGHQDVLVEAGTPAVVARKKVALHRQDRERQAIARHREQTHALRRDAADRRHRAGLGLTPMADRDLRDEIGSHLETVQRLVPNDARDTLAAVEPFLPLQPPAEYRRDASSWRSATDALTAGRALLRRLGNQ